MNITTSVRMFLHYFHFLSLNFCKGTGKE